MSSRSHDPIESILEAVDQLNGQQVGELHRRLDVLPRSVYDELRRYCEEIFQLHLSFIAGVTPICDTAYRRIRKPSDLNKELLRLHEEEGKTYSELALDFGKEREAIRSRIRRARPK